MCGRFSSTINIKELERRFKAELAGEPLAPNSDARPTQQLYTILNTNPEEIRLARWSFSPPWKDARPIINARADSLAKKRMYKEPLEKRRCLILANAFYEWQGEPGRKTKYRFELMDSEPFAFAGIWQEEPNEQGIVEPHFVIITTEPNNVVAPIHNRMPAILIPDDEAKWLSSDFSPREALSMLEPYPADQMRAIQEPATRRQPVQNSA